MSGKGSRPRPFSVDQKTFDNNWDAIFGKKEQSKNLEEQKKESDKKTVDSEKKTV